MPREYKHIKEHNLKQNRPPRIDKSVFCLNFTCHKVLFVLSAQLGAVQI